MDLDKLTFFAMAKKRLEWLSQRQDVLAQNIANADTPHYRPRDLQPLSFKDLVGQETKQVNMAMTEKGHLEGRRRSTDEFTEKKERKPFETLPSGNAVDLEEQMGKLNETSVSHKLTVQLYTEQLNMIKTALDKD